jgi:formylglycine-generating enzyme required for sulfatase activity
MLAQLNNSIRNTAQRLRVTSGSLANMVCLEGGSFFMGCESPLANPGDGEGPVRKVTLGRFAISRFAVTNEQFAEFAKKTRYLTSAEQLGWSFVFRSRAKESDRGAAPLGTPWWACVQPIALGPATVYLQKQNGNAEPGEGLSKKSTRGVTT